MLSRLHRLPTNCVSTSDTAKHVEKIHTFHLFLTPSHHTCQSFHSWCPGKFVFVTCPWSSWSLPGTTFEYAKGCVKKVAINLLAETLRLITSNDPHDGILKYALTFYFNISESIWNILTFCLIHSLRTLRMVLDAFSDILSDKISRTYSLLTYDRACYISGTFSHISLTLSSFIMYRLRRRRRGGGGPEWENLN